MTPFSADSVLARLDADAELIGRLYALGEDLAAGFLEYPGRSPLRKMAGAVRRQLSRAALPQWRGEALYPAGPYSWWRPAAVERLPVVRFEYSHSLTIDRRALEARASQAEGWAGEAYRGLLAVLGDYPQVGAPIDPDISLGGRNYTHSIINYGRVLRKGLASYEYRIARGLAAARARNDTEREDLYLAMQDTLEGIREAHCRGLAALRNAQPSDAASAEWWTWQRLVAALEQVPERPARSFYEALVATNWLYYIDGTDNLGRFDQDLGRCYEADLDTGALTHAEGVALVAQLWDNVNANSGWNVAIGGTGADGASVANRLTLACIEAARGHRRPNLALRLSTQTPEAVLDAALDTIATGCGIPALYNEEAYLRAIREAHLNLPPKDLVHFAFGGCTELMVHGCSNVGSLDAGLNLPLILSEALRKHLTTAESFEALWEGWAAELRVTVARLTEQVSRAQAEHARYQPQPIRTLFVDDCLEAGVEYNAGGARYNWSVVNVGGLANVADALVALKQLVFDGGDVEAEAYWQALQGNFAEYEALRQRILRCSRYGNDCAVADEMAQRVARLVFDELRRYAPWRGGRFLPACLMFVTYVGAGMPVMATPDGRLAGELIADSIGPVAGRDHSGPTAMARSVAGIPQGLAPGTLVTNLRLAPSMFAAENRDRVKELIRTYFDLGGMQMQITVIDQETLQRAVEAPEEYGDLIVRVGGYSEYWRNLDDGLPRSVLQRTEHVM